MSIYDGSKRDTSNFVSDKYLAINSCGFQHAAAKYQVIRKNGREDFHILLINNGDAKVLHGGKTHQLTKGNFVLYAPHEAQRYTFLNEGTSLWCHFSGAIIKEVLRDCGLQSGVYYTSPDSALQDAFTNMIQRFHQPGRQKYANPFLLELLYRISDKVSNSSPSDSLALLPILTFINANYHKKITLDELAKKSGYSKSRFSHIFSEVVGTSPLQYQNNIRLGTARELLSATDRPITDIALCCGFTDPLYFSRLFKRKYGITPSEYRKNGL